MTESDFASIADAGRQAAEIMSLSHTASKQAAEIISRPRTASMLTPAVVEAARSLDSLRLGNASALAEAAKAFEAVRPMVASEFAETLKHLRSPLLAPEVAAVLQTQREIVPRLPKELLHRHVAAVVQPRLAEALKGWEMPDTTIRLVSESIRAAGVAPWLEIGPLVGEVVRQAAEVAEASAAGDVAAEAVESLDLGHASPEKRRDLRADLVNAIGLLTAVVAFFVRTQELDLAARLLPLIACLMVIAGRLGDE